MLQFAISILRALQIRLLEGWVVIVHMIWLLSCYVFLLHREVMIHHMIDVYVLLLIWILMMDPSEVRSRSYVSLKLRVLTIRPLQLAAYYLLLLGRVVAGWQLSGLDYVFEFLVWQIFGIYYGHCILFVLRRHFTLFVQCHFLFISSKAYDGRVPLVERVLLMRGQLVFSIDLLKLTFHHRQFDDIAFAHLILYIWIFEMWWK